MRTASAGGAAAKRSGVRKEAACVRAHDRRVPMHAGGRARRGDRLHPWSPPMQPASRHTCDPCNRLQGHACRLSPCTPVVSTMKPGAASMEAQLASARRPPARPPAHLTHGEAVAADDVCGVHLVLHELVCTLKELRRKDHHRRGAVPHLCVLQLCQLDQDLCACRIPDRGQEHSGRGKPPAAGVDSCWAGIPSATIPVPRNAAWLCCAVPRTLAAGCSTSRSFRMVAPSFVTVTSPMSSTSICRSHEVHAGHPDSMHTGAAAAAAHVPANARVLSQTLSKPTGPRELFTMLAMADTAMTFWDRTSCPL